MSLSRPGDREPALLSPGFVDRLGIFLEHMLQSLEFSVERIPLGLVYAASSCMDRPSGFSFAYQS